MKIRVRCLLVLVLFMSFSVFAEKEDGGLLAFGPTADLLHFNELNSKLQNRSKGIENFVVNFEACRASSRCYIQILSAKKITYKSKYPDQWLALLTQARNSSGNNGILQMYCEAWTQPRSISGFYGHCTVYEK